MNKTTIARAVEEAEGFIGRARDVQQLYGEKPYWPHSGAETGALRRKSMDLTGALRRKSMDLTRALAAMRKPY